MTGLADLPGDLAAIAQEAGITRLAELTGLDCIGIPVWQAVRPWSRALSVHQGKGVTTAIARRGAVMEAIESHHAEQWRPDAALAFRRCWSDLDKDHAAAIDDFARRRGGVTETAALDWIAVEPLGNSQAFVVPVDAVGLDCTMAETSGIAIDSNGLAAHFDTCAATLAAVLELVERDAVGRWKVMSPVLRGGTALAVGGIDCPLVQDWAARCLRQGIAVRLYTLAAVVPVVVTELQARSPDGAEHHHVWGSAAGLDWPASVRAAMLEALQTRCSQIAGSRDTIPLRHASRDSAQFQGFSLPLAGDWAGHPLPPPVADAATGLDDVLAALARTGRRHFGRIILSPPESRAVTVKAFVPGLGFEARASRPT